MYEKIFGRWIWFVITLNLVPLPQCQPGQIIGQKCAPLGSLLRGVKGSKLNFVVCAQYELTLKISSQSIHNFLTYLAQMNGEINKKWHNPPTLSGTKNKKYTTTDLFSEQSIGTVGHKVIVPSHTKHQYANEWDELVG